MRYVYDAKQGKVVPKSQRTDTPPLAPMISPDWKPYKSPLGDGKVIDGRSEARAHHAKNGTRILEPGETRQAMEIRERNLAELRSTRDPMVSYERGESHGGIDIRGLDIRRS